MKPIDDESMQAIRAAGMSVFDVIDYDFEEVTEEEIAKVGATLKPVGADEKVIQTLSRTARIWWVLACKYAAACDNALVDGSSKPEVYQQFGALHEITTEAAWFTIRAEADRWTKGIAIRAGFVIVQKQRRRKGAAI